MSAATRRPRRRKTLGPRPRGARRAHRRRPRIFRELADERGVECVPTLGLGECDPQDMFVAHELQRFHSRTPYGFDRGCEDVHRRARARSKRRRCPVSPSTSSRRSGARPPLKVTIRDHTWRTTPGVRRVGHVVVNRTVKAATGVDAGDRVRVADGVDTEPRTVAVPVDLRAALKADPEVNVAFDALSFTHRREYVEWVEDAKVPRRAFGALRVSSTCP